MSELSVVMGAVDATASAVKECRTIEGGEAALQVAREALEEAEVAAADLEELENLDAFCMNEGSNNEHSEFEGVASGWRVSENGACGGTPCEEMQWAEADETDIRGFRELLPAPRVEYPFELDPFQKRAILHLEKGEHVFGQLCTRTDPLTTLPPRALRFEPPHSPSLSLPFFPTQSSPTPLRVSRSSQSTPSPLLSPTSPRLSTHRLSRLFPIRSSVTLRHALQMWV